MALITRDSTLAKRPKQNAPRFEKPRGEKFPRASNRSKGEWRRSPLDHAAAGRTVEVDHEQ